MIGEWVREVGRSTIAWATFSRDLGVLAYGALKSIALVRTRGARVVWEILLAQIRFTGAQGVSLMAFASLAIGTLVLIEAVTFIPSADTVPHVVSHITIKDIAPLLTALVIIGRSGTAISVELANMKLNGEVDALVTMGLSLEHVVVLPRLLGAIVSFLGMTIVGQASALVGGYILAGLVVRPPFGLRALVGSIELDDIGVSLLKAVLLATVIAVVCIREGLSVEASPREVPQAATRGVVRSMTICLVLNSFLSIYT